jgi:hypothetical protein
MANLISYDRRADMAPIQINNSLTALFIVALTLAASDLAASDEEREFAAWFASHDQSIFGPGVVGFDISQMPWHSDRFAADLEFVLSAVRAAHQRHGWDRLGYTPAPDAISSRLEHFEAMILAFDPADRIDDPDEVWNFGGKPDRFELCPRHAVYLHANGCALCNDR